MDTRIVPACRPETKESEDAHLIAAFRGALTRISLALHMPGSPDLVTDVPAEVERRLAMGGEDQATDGKNRMHRATRIVAAALWFDDSSDYGSALWDTLRALVPDLGAMPGDDDLHRLADFEARE